MTQVQHGDDSSSNMPNSLKVLSAPLPPAESTPSQATTPATQSGSSSLDSTETAAKPSGTPPPVPAAKPAKNCALIDAQFASIYQNSVTGTLKRADQSLPQYNTTEGRLNAIDIFNSSMDAAYNSYTGIVRSYGCNPTFPSPSYIPRI